MLLSTAEDLAKYVEELKRESDRGLALVATALIDDRLKEALRALLCENKGSARLLEAHNAPLGTFAARADACLALGLIDDFEYSEISLLRKVRNEFAHLKHGVTFQEQRIKGFCASLTSPLPEGVDYPTSEARFRFTNAAVCIVLRLYHRPEWVALERRKPKSWVETSFSEWRLIKDNPPPDDTPVMVIGKSR